MNDIFDTIKQLIIYEKENGIVFDLNGFPIFSEKMFYNGNISISVPYEHRKEMCSNAIINFYSHDSLLYRKLNVNKLDIVSNELKKYNGFIGFDLSIFEDFSLKIQKFYILCNLVIDMYLILKGNKMVPNIRWSPFNYYYLFNDARIVCCGLIGNSKNKEIRNKNKEYISLYKKEHRNQKVYLYGSNLTDLKCNIITPYRRRKKHL